MKLFLEIDDSLRGKEIYLYGAGGAAQNLAKQIYNEWGQEIAGFLTSFQPYELHGEKVDNFFDKKADLDNENSVIIVMNQFAREICHILKDNVHHAEVLNGIHAVFPYRNEIKDAHVDAMSAMSKNVLDRLSTSRSKTLYETLINLRLPISSAIPLKDIYERFWAAMSEMYGNEDLYYNLHYVEYSPAKSIKIIIEGGVCYGDTSLKLLKYFPKIEHLYGFDPSYSEVVSSGRNSKFLPNLRKAEEEGKLSIVEKALWDKKETLHFNSGSGEFSSGCISDTGTEIQAISLDEFVSEEGIKKIDFIKLDIEGAELHFLHGGMKTILKDRPIIAVSIYHYSNQIITIPDLLMKSLENYKYEIGHHSNSPWLETVLYAIPNEQ